MIDVTRYLEHGDASVDRLRAEIERGLGGGIHMAVHATRGPHGVTVHVAALDGELDEAALEVVREAVRAHDPHAPDPAEAARQARQTQREATRQWVVGQLQSAVGLHISETDVQQKLALLAGIAFVVGAIDNTGQVRPAGEWLR